MCGAGFNPGCSKHWEYYFDVGEAKGKKEMEDG